jgi:FkbM family methyltransferase
LIGPHRAGNFATTNVEDDLGMITYHEQILRTIGHASSGLPGSHRLIRKLSPRYDNPHSFTVSALGINYTGELSDLIDWTIFYFGYYAFAELSFLSRCAERLARQGHDVNFFDIGANVGQHSLFMSKRVSEVHAFEPSRHIGDRFSNNILTNGLDNIHLHRVALGDADAELQLGSGVPGNTGSRSFTWSLPDGPTERVIVKRADTYFIALKLPQIHILKIDVEGFEKKVLQGLGARLAADRPIILMEFIGSRSKKGGFTSENELRSLLYPEHELCSLSIRRNNYRLVSFDWDLDCVVVRPLELSNETKSGG